MGMLLYSNGIIEDMLPANIVFTDDELIKTFDGFKTIRSSRLVEVPNTWCVWGEMENPLPNEYNTIGSEIVDVDIDSHLLLIHDSEINPDWNLTDNILYKSYEEFRNDIDQFISEIVDVVSQHNQDTMKKSNTSMIFLTPVGQTDAKQVLFSFNPDEQEEHFFENGGFDTFANKIWEYLEATFSTNDLEPESPFVIFADNKTMVMVQNEFFDTFIKRMLDIFLLKEQYEICTHINNIKDQWHKYLKGGNLDVSPVRKRRSRPPRKLKENE